MYLLKFDEYRWCLSEFVNRRIWIQSNIEPNWTRFYCYGALRGVENTQTSTLDEVKGVERVERLSIFESFWIFSVVEKSSISKRSSITKCCGKWSSEGFIQKKKYIQKIMTIYHAWRIPSFNSICFHAAHRSPSLHIFDTLLSYIANKLNTLQTVEIFHSSDTEEEWVSFLSVIESIIFHSTLSTFILETRYYAPLCCTLLLSWVSKCEERVSRSVDLLSNLKWWEQFPIFFFSFVLL